MALPNTSLTSDFNKPSDLPDLSSYHTPVIVTINGKTIIAQRCENGEVLIPYKKITLLQKLTEKFNLCSADLFLPCFVDIGLISFDLVYT